jgi:RNA polymerase sigma factor (TIGR02999 family)
MCPHLGRIAHRANTSIKHAARISPVRSARRCMRAPIAASLAHEPMRARTMVNDTSDIKDGDELGPQSVDAMFNDVYDRLKAMAGHQLALRRPGATLDTTALVHDVYLRMNAQELTFARRAQFFAYAARAMRSLLIDHARQRLSTKAGGEWLRVTLSGKDQELVIDSAEHVLALESAIAKLEKLDARAERVLELRYYAGLTVEQIGEVMDIGPRTVDRDWRFAVAFLRGEIG